MLFNGTLIHEDVVMKKHSNDPSNLVRKESPQGPLLLQGSFGPVAYRNIRITPLAAANSQSAIGNPPWNTPAFQAWMKTVAALPAEKQVEAVSKKLMELNPGFDGKVAGWDENRRTQD